MTVKEFFPKLTREERCIIGRALFNRYKAIKKEKPPQVSEDEFVVRTYPRIFLIDSVKVRNRFKRKYPNADITQAQRRRVPHKSNANG